VGESKYQLIRYLTLCALSALFKWLEGKGITFGRNSVSMKFEKPEGEYRSMTLTTDTVFIDAETVRNLELVTNQLSNKTTNTLFGEWPLSYADCRAPQHLLYSDGCSPFTI
jgi:DNA mismatch repair protein MSH4